MRPSDRSRLHMSLLQHNMPLSYMLTFKAAMPSARAMVFSPAGAPDSEGASSGISISSTTTARSCKGQERQRTDALCLICNGTQQLADNVQVALSRQTCEGTTSLLHAYLKQEDGEGCPSMP